MNHTLYKIGFAVKGSETIMLIDDFFLYAEIVNVLLSLLTRTFDKGKKNIDFFFHSNFDIGMLTF